MGTLPVSPPSVARGEEKACRSVCGGAGAAGKVFGLGCGLGQVQAMQGEAEGLDVDAPSSSPWLCGGQLPSLEGPWPAGPFWLHPQPQARWGSSPGPPFSSPPQWALQQVATSGVLTGQTEVTSGRRNIRPPTPIRPSPPTGEPQTLRSLPGPTPI